MKRFVQVPLVIFAAVFLASFAGAAELAVNNLAAMEGEYGLEVICDGVNLGGAYVQDDSPNGESTYRAKFLFNPAQIEITQTGSILESRHWIFTMNGTSVVSQNVRVGGVYLLKKSGKYWVATQGENTAAGAKKNSPKIMLGDAGVENSPHLIEIEWQASSVSGGYGLLRMRVDGGTWAEVPGLKNYSQVVNTARLGIVIGLDPDTVGSHFFDSFESYRTLSP